MVKKDVNNNHIDPEESTTGAAATITKSEQVITIGRMTRQRPLEPRTPGKQNRRRPNSFRTPTRVQMARSQAVAGRRGRASPTLMPARPPATRPLNPTTNDDPITRPIAIENKVNSKIQDPEATIGNNLYPRSSLSDLTRSRLQAPGE